MSPLSPAAQAVLDAFNAAPPDFNVHQLPPDCGRVALTAALRELASFSNGHWLTPARLRAIAAELEGGR